MPDFNWNDLAVAIGQPKYDNRRHLLRALTWKVLSHWTTDDAVAAPVAAQPAGRQPPATSCSPGPTARDCATCSASRR